MAIIENSIQNIELHLDLEQTIIKDWNDRQIINVEPIRNFIRYIGVDHVYIFSFAIWNDDDCREIDSTLVFLEKILGVNIMKPPTIQDFIAHLLRERKVKVEQSEIFDFFGKERMFLEWCRTKKNTNCFLVDDMVQDMNISIFSNNTTIRYFNIDTVRERFK